MIITKKDVKILRYINRHGSVPKDKLSKKFSSDRVLLLLDGKYLSCDKKFSSKSGYALQTIPSDSAFRLTDLGISTLEKYQWFDFQYFITHMVLPVLIGVTSSVITAILLRML